MCVTVIWFANMAWFMEHVRTDHWLFISCNILVQITGSILCFLIMRVKKDRIVRLFLYCTLYRYIELKKWVYFCKSINQVPGDGFALVTR